MSHRPSRTSRFAPWRALAVVVLLVLAAPWVLAATTPPTTAETPPDFPLLDRPNSGRPPEHATDFGGWAQFAVFGGIMVAVGGGILLIAAESRRKKRRAGVSPQAGATASSTRSEPHADTSAKRPDSTARQ